MWVAETGVRFEKYIKSTSQEPQVSEQSPLVNEQKSHLVEEGRHEVIDLVGYYLGSFQKGLYQISLMALMYIGLLAYSQVFCGAVAAVLWGAAEGAWAGVPQLIFGMMVIPLSCMELDEQVSIQAIMALVRFVAIFIIVFGSVSALYLDDSESSGNHAPHWAPQELEGCVMSYTSCFSGFGVAFSTSLFSQLFQHSIPGLLRPLKEQPEKLPHVPVCCAKNHVLFQNATLLTSPPSPTALDSANTRSFSFNYIEPIPAAWNDRSILFWRWNAIFD